MDAHAPSEVTEKLVIFRFWTRNSDAECGIREGLFHNADELNDVLRHRGEKRENEAKKPGYPS